MPGRAERNRMASSWGVIIVIIGIIAFSFRNIYKSNLEIKTKELEQTAIARVFSEAGTAMIVLGPDGKILYWDQGAVRIFGYTSDEVSNEGIGIVMPGHSADGIGFDENSQNVKITTCEGRDKGGDAFQVSMRMYSPFKKNQALILADRLKPETVTKR